MENLLDYNQLTLQPAKQTNSDSESKQQKSRLIFGWNGKAKTYNNATFDPNLKQENTVQIKSRIKKVKVTIIVEFFAI